MRPLRVLESCLYVDDLEAAVRFYGEALGLEMVSRVEGRHAFFRCGESMVLLFDPARTEVADAGVPPHGARGPGHLAFAVAEGDLPRWRDALERSGVAIEAEIEWPRGGRSLYLRDPDGNSVELATASIWGL